MTLEWVTEFLSFNIAAYCKKEEGVLDDGGWWSVQKAHWVELDGGEHTGVIEARRQKRDAQRSHLTESDM